MKRIGATLCVLAFAGSALAAPTVSVKMDQQGDKLWAYLSVTATEAGDLAVLWDAPDGYCGDSTYDLRYKPRYTAKTVDGKQTSEAAPYVTKANRTVRHTVIGADCPVVCIGMWKVTVTQKGTEAALAEATFEVTKTSGGEAEVKAAEPEAAPAVEAAPAEAAPAAAPEAEKTKKK